MTCIAPPILQNGSFESLLSLLFDMNEVTIHIEPGLVELVVKNEATKQILATYIREHSITFSKEENGVILSLECFGRGVMHRWKELYLQTTVNPEACFIENTKGIKCNLD